MSDATTYYVYTLLAIDGSALYVGCSGRPGTRLGQHQYKPWFSLVTSVTFERYPTKAAARDAEAHAIGRLNPPHNIVHRSEIDQTDQGGWRTRRANRAGFHALGETCWDSACRECRDQKLAARAKHVVSRPA